jgi:hypothetical protein
VSLASRNAVAYAEPHLNRNNLYASASVVSRTLRLINKSKNSNRSVDGSGIAPL